MVQINWVWADRFLYALCVEYSSWEAALRRCYGKLRSKKIDTASAELLVANSLERLRTDKFIDWLAL